MIYRIIYIKNKGLYMALANSSNTIEIEKLNIINNFKALPDWQMKYGYLIDLGKQLIAKNEHIKTDDNRFYGCQSSVW